MKSLRRLADRFEHASQSYAASNNIARNDEWFLLKLAEELGELTQAWMKHTGRGRPKGRTEAELRKMVEDETADLFGHVLLFARHNGIDLEPAVVRKWRFEPEISEGEGSE